MSRKQQNREENMSETLPKADVAVNRIASRLTSFQAELASTGVGPDTRSLYPLGARGSTAVPTEPARRSAPATPCWSEYEDAVILALQKIDRGEIAWLYALPRPSLDHSQSTPLDISQLGLWVVLGDDVEMSPGYRPTPGRTGEGVPASEVDKSKQPAGEDEWEEYEEPIWDPVKHKVHLAVREYFEQADADSDFSKRRCSLDAG